MCVIPEGVKKTPMLEQYFYWKKEYPDCILFFRMGDFFEMFFEDAKVASKVLDLTLTARDQEKKIPMAGVPFHAAENYLGRLVEAGFRVALCDQVEEPDGKKLVDRRVIRVVTPGTYTSTDNRPDGRLAVLRLRGNTGVFAFLVPCTGVFEAGTLLAEEIPAQLRAFGPGDILVPSSEEKKWGLLLEDELARKICVRPPENFDPHQGEAYLARSFGTNSLEGFGFSRGDPALGCAAAALRYVEETQFTLPRHICQLTPCCPSTFLYLDGTTQKNLELLSGEGNTLYGVLNRCRNPMGKRMLQEWILRPLRDDVPIRERQESVRFCVENPGFSQELGALLGACHDVERALGRLSFGVGAPRDLGSLKSTLEMLPSLENLLETSPLSGRIAPSPEVLALRFLLLEGLKEDLPAAWKYGEVVASGFDEELDRFRDAHSKGERWLQKYLEEERQRTGIRNMKVGSNRVFGYYLEVSRSQSASVPPEYVRKQTLVSSERYITEKLKDFEETLFSAERLAEDREREIYAGFCRNTMDVAEELQSLAREIARTDVLRSLGEVAWERKYVCPSLNGAGSLEIQGGRHPVVEVSLKQRSFVPNALELSHTKGRIAIVTGPNMAGKSTYLRMGALLIIMAHMGSFVPADTASIPLTDRIFTRIGARDELDRGNSTFMVEMVETANILRNITSRSFVVLDEIGRGTSTYDGMSIAWSVLEYLARHSEEAKVLFATHYHELTRLAEEYEEIQNLSMDVDETEEGVVFLHKVVSAPADRSYGIEVARLAGVPDPVIQRSRELLQRFEEKALLAREEDLLPPEVPGQKKLFPHPEMHALVDELARLKPDNMTPLKALEVLYALRARSLKVLEEERMT